MIRRWAVLLAGALLLVGALPAGVASASGNPPVAAVSAVPNPVRVSTITTVTAIDSTDPDNDITSYDFDYGDGTSDVGLAWWFHDHTYAIPGTYTVTATVHDATGLSDQETTQVQVRPYFGSNAGGDYRSTYDPIKVQRVFFSGAPGSWTTHPDLSANIPTIVSFKYSPTSVTAGTYDSALQTFFSTMPTNRPVWWCYYHEPEDQVYVSATFTAAQYRAAWIHIKAIADTYAPSNAKATVILMSATLSVSGRNWEDFYADDDTSRSNGSPYVDAIFWDLYWGTSDDGTTAPSQDLFDRFGTGSARDVYAVNALTGEAFGVAEFGYDHDATRPGILSQLEQFAIYGPGSSGGVPPTTSQHPPVTVAAVTYFDEFGSTGHHELDDTSSQSTWASIVAA